MSPIRRIISFICAVGLTLGGSLWLWFELFAAQHAFSKMIIGACFVLSLGVIWLWDDFIKPSPRHDG